MITYLPLYHTPVLPFRNIFLSKAHMLRIMDVSLRKAPSVSLRFRYTAAKKFRRKLQPLSRVHERYRQTTDDRRICDSKNPNIRVIMRPKASWAWKVHLHPSFISLCLLVRKLSCWHTDKPTNPHTNPQTIRRRRNILWNGSRDPSHAFFQGWSVVRRLRLNIACKHTKFDDPSFSRSRDILGGVKF